jgi:hypothetical protein
MNPRVDDCLAACLECHRICLETVSYLTAGEHAVGAEDIRLLFNTAEVCRTHASLLRELCEQAARFCDGRTGEPRLQACAAACYRCAEACRGIAARAA